MYCISYHYKLASGSSELILKGPWFVCLLIHLIIFLTLQPRLSIEYDYVNSSCLFTNQCFYIVTMITISNLYLVVFSQVHMIILIEVDFVDVSCLFSDSWSHWLQLCWKSCWANTLCLSAYTLSHDSCFHDVSFCSCGEGQRTFTSPTTHTRTFRKKIEACV